MTRTRTSLAAVGVVCAIAVALVVAALLAWPHAAVKTDDAALARVTLPGFAGRVTSVSARAADGTRVPVELRQGKIWPSGMLDSGEQVTVDVTVRRPGWAGWLVGHDEHRSFTLDTPTATLRGRWLQARSGAPVTVSFNKPVALVSLAHRRPVQLTRARSVVPVGLVASGKHTAGAIWVAGAARTWERLPAPVRVSWFPSRPYPQLLVSPALGTPLPPAGQVTLTFSSPVSTVLGSRRPRLIPSLPGKWRSVDAHTIAFKPSGLGFGLGGHVYVLLRRGAHLAGQPGSKLTSAVQWQVPAGSTLRLQQLLANLGYLPVSWQPTDADAAPTARSELSAAVSPPSGTFSWRYPNTPPELQALWSPGRANQVTRGAVMMFENTHDLTSDGLAGPQVWRALIADAIAGKRRDDGYSYVFVHRNVPQLLSLWHNGKVILTSPGNTGVPAAPTQLGTYPVFEHISSGTMEGTNPDGSHYNDPDIRWISYFHGGDALHAFNRASFGTPQSLGCVELPLDAAAKVWPYTPIGTLVTIEN